MTSMGSDPAPGKKESASGPPGQIRPPGSQVPSRPQWQPGVVEIKLREHVRPNVISTTAGAGPRIESTAGISLDALNAALNEHGILDAEHTVITPADEADRLQSLGTLQGIDVPHLTHFVTLHFPANADVERIARELSALPEVELATPVPERGLPKQLKEPLIGDQEVVFTDEDKNSPYYKLEHQWYVYRCHADLAWDKSDGTGVVIADIDSGFRPTHEDLAPNIDAAHTYNSYDGGSDVSHEPVPLPAGVADYLKHGTSVLGLVGAAVNGKGMAGFAYGATLWPVQSYWGPGASRGGDPHANGVAWVTGTSSAGKPKVINLELQTTSFGNAEQYPAVNAAIKAAIASGVAVCLAAGNGGRDTAIDDSGKPIPESGAILVGATAYDDRANPRGWFSNFGSRVMICAPGDEHNDVTCDNTSDTAYHNDFGGTSGATPKVAGTVALMLAVNPNLTTAQIRTLLNMTGSTPTFDFEKPIGSFLDTNAAVVAAAKPAHGAYLAAYRNLGFGQTDKGKSLSLLVPVFNLGVDPLTITKIERTQGSSDFSLVAPPALPLANPLVIAPGGKQDLTFQFLPTSRGDQSATFQFESNDPTSPHSLSCTGTVSSFWPTLVAVGLVVLGAAVVIGGSIGLADLLTPKPKA